MNIIFTLSALKSVGFSRLVKIAVSDIKRYAEDAGHSATLIFEDTLSNALVGNIVQAVMKALPNVAFAMVSDLNKAEIKRMLAEVYEGQTVITRVVDKPEMLN